MIRSTVQKVIQTCKLRFNVSQRDFSSSLFRCSDTFMPCLDDNESREKRLIQDKLRQLGYTSKSASSISKDHDPIYSREPFGFEVFKYEKPFKLQHGGCLNNGFHLAYECWGSLNESKSNVILLHTGLSASSHAKSHEKNSQKGWWEQFIGPGLSLDTNKFFIICTNVLGSCFGSTGPSSIDPQNGKPYATNFPSITIKDMVRAQRILLNEQFQVPELYASVGSSMGGMQSLAMSVLYPDYVKRCVSISACARSHPYSIALRYAQRAVLVNDPNWNRGYYYPEFQDDPQIADGKTLIPPHVGMKLARMIATVAYRSGPEWESRFGRRKLTNEERELERKRLNIKHPYFCSEFLVESYLDHQAMDLFDLSMREKCVLDVGDDSESIANNPPPVYQCRDEVCEQDEDLKRGLSRISANTLVLGVQSDILFPISQQKEIADFLRLSDVRVTYYELDSIYGHDTFLMDLQNTGAAVKGHLER